MISTAVAIGEQTCPECGAALLVFENVRIWCPQCNWNIGEHTLPADDNFVAQQYARLGKRYGQAALDALKLLPPDQLKPRPNIRNMIAFSLAAGVHLLSLALLVVGVALIVGGFPEIPSLLLGAALCGFAWIMRPRPEEQPTFDIVSRASFPALHMLVNDVARKLGGRPVNTIVVNEDFNAAYGVYGWQREPVLYLGLPLWISLSPKERLDLLGHEIGHGVNGDATRGFIVWAALRALNEWIYFLRAPFHHAETALQMVSACVPWVLSVPFALLRSVLIQLLWIDKQRAEYFADYLGSTISGTDASVSSLRKMRVGAEHMEGVLLRHAVKSSQSGAYILGLFRQHLVSLPECEWERYARLGESEGTRLDNTHPPTAHRVAFLEAHRVTEPLVAVDDDTMARVDTELATLEDKIGKRMIANFLNRGGAD